MLAAFGDGVGPTGSAGLMFAMQTALNFFVPSGSEQAENYGVTP